MQTGPVAPQPEVHAEAPEAQPALSQPKPVDEAPAPVTPALKIGMGARIGMNLILNDPSDDVKLTLFDGLADQVLLRPYFSAQLTEHVGVTANLEFGTGKSGIGISILDAIAQVKVVDEFQVWIGQHIPANDRMNFQGPFFNNAWIFESPASPAFPFDRGARDRGFTLWGLVGGGLLKYHLSMVDLQPGMKIGKAAYAARATFNFLDPENYYYFSGTYYGEKDILALGGVVRYQDGIGAADDGSGMLAKDLNGDGKVDNDFLAGSVDLLFEKRTTAGTFTVQAIYWNLNGTGADYVVNQGSKDVGSGLTGPHPGQSVLVDLSWLSPTKVGPGKLQPNVHFYWGDYDTAGESKYYDVGLGYIVDGFNHRWYLNYRHGDAPAGNEDSLQLGAQLQI